MATVPPSTPFTFLVRRTPGGGLILGILQALVGVFTLAIGIFFTLTALTITGVVSGLAVFAPLGVDPSQVVTYSISAVLFIAASAIAFVLAAGMVTTRGFSRLVSVVLTVLSLVTTTIFLFVVLVFVPIALSPANITNTVIALIGPVVLTLFSIISLGYLGRPRTRVIYETPFRPFSASSFLGTPPITPTPTSATVPAIPTPVQTLFPGGGGGPFGVTVPGGFSGGFPTGFQGFPTGFQGFPTGFQGFPTGFQGFPTGFQGFPPFGVPPFAGPFGAPFAGAPAPFPFPFYRPFPPGFPMSTVTEPQTFNVRPVPVPVGGSAEEEGFEDELEPLKPSISYCRHCGSRVGQSMYCDHCGGRTN